MLYASLVELIGDVPPGFQPLVYVFSCVVLLWLLSTTFSILWSVIGWIGGRR